MGESIKHFAARVTNATLKFLGDVKIEEPSIKKICDQTKLSKFIEGVRPEFKKPLLLKDPETLESAISYAELLELNEEITTSGTINNITTETEIDRLIERHTQNTHEMISNLSREINKLKINANSMQHENTEQGFCNNMRTKCQICAKLGHEASQCYYRNQPSSQSPNYPTNRTYTQDNRSRNQTRGSNQTYFNSRQHHTPPRFERNYREQSYPNRAIDQSQGFSRNERNFGRPQSRERFQQNRAPNRDFNYRYSSHSRDRDYNRSRDYRGQNRDRVRFQSPLNC